MKHIALFGGTGYVGSCLRRHLVVQGYAVKMLVRDASTLNALSAHQSIDCIPGTIDDPLAVSQTLEGCDACMVVTGPRSRDLMAMQAVVAGTNHILAAMAEQGMQRLIKLSGVSVRVPGEPFPLPRRLLDIALGIALKNSSNSKYLEQDAIFTTDLDWTIVRAPVIADKHFTKPLAAHDFNYLGLKVGLDDLCKFMIEQLYSHAWVRKCPTVGY